MRERKATFCTLCSLACPFSVDLEDGDPVGLEYAADDAITGGSLCAKGNMAFELLRLPGRIDRPAIGGQAVRWPEALSRLAAEIERLPDGKVGLVLGADASAEEARAAGLFVQKCLAGAPSAVAFWAREPAVLAEAGAEPPVPELEMKELGGATTVLAVGDVFALCPVISRPALDAKYGGRGHSLVYLGPDAGLTVRMAGARVIGPERRAALAVLQALAAADSPSADVKKVADLLSGKELGVPGAAEAARALSAGERVAVLAGTADPVAVRLARLIAAALGEKASFLALAEAACARDILDNWRPAGDLAALVEAVKGDEVRGLIVLGADIVGSGAMSAAEMERLLISAAGSTFPSKTTAAAKYVLPTALWMEKGGRMAGRQREPAAPPAGGARDYGWILAGLARELGAELVGEPAGAAAGPMALEDVLRQAAGDEGPGAPWTARESSDPLVRAALGGVYVA